MPYSDFGRVILNLLPSVDLDSTDIKPSCSSVIFLQKARPRPVPEYSFEVFLFVFVVKNELKIFCKSGKIPNFVKINRFYRSFYGRMASNFVCRCLSLQVLILL